MPLRHLIALIINAHHASAAFDRSSRSGRTLMRKTSLLLQDRPDDVRSSSPTLDASLVFGFAASTMPDPWVCVPPRAFAPGRYSDRSPLHDVRQPRPWLRLAAQRQNANSCMRTSTVVPPGGARRDRTDDLLLAKQALSQLSYGPAPEGLVGLDRLERSTSPLSGVRSNHLSYRPQDCKVLKRAHALNAFLARAARPFTGPKPLEPDSVQLVREEREA
jgi:hypothetical protein